MLVSNNNFKRSNARFLRQLFFEERLLFLDCQLDGTGGLAYYNDGSIPFDWASSPRSVIDQIIYLDSLNREPIKLMIDSPGGLASAYLNLYDIMKASRSPIYTVATGVVASAAVPILVGGEPGHRYILPNSRTMIHMPRSHFGGDPKEVENQVREFNKVKTLYIGILSRHTNKAPDLIESDINRLDFWMDAKESVAYGLVDHVLNSFSEFALL
ncbi:MAG: ATP-dependent Clp protease proteolytic subunit [Parcubacteria group bacterium]|nr:ATP-dependent Clp protease proteolytic subunit [Parcubacteria group bacterium]